MNGYEFFEHTADVGIIARGKTIEEAFENAAKAVFEIMTDTSKIEAKECRDISTFGYDLENLLYKWIEELLYYHDTETLVFTEFQVRIDKENMTLTGKACGEKFDPNKHEKRTVVKAMTYHMMEIRQENGNYVVQFVVDI
jgi:SHS2 domain-containing protein